VKKVIIVDDESINRRLTRSFLNELGYKDDDVLEFKDGEAFIENLKIIDINSIGYIILDIYMPYLNGIEVINIMKNDEKLKNIPIIVITTDDKLKSQVENVADDFLVRPVIFNDFVKVISQYAIEG